MHIPAILSAALATASVALSQSTVVFFASVGPTQTIPDPAGGTNGAASLFGIFGPAAGGFPAFLRFALNGVPSAYGGTATQESIIFALDFGVPATTGTPLLGGLVFMPNPATAPVTFLVNGSSYLGPADTVPTGGTSGGVQDPLNNGARLDLSSLLVPAAVGVNLTIQGSMLDPAINTLFTSNAIGFRVM